MVNELEKIILDKMESDKREREKKMQTQEEISIGFSAKCNEIVNNLDFLKKYGFDFLIKDEYQDDWCSHYHGYYIKVVRMTHNGNHFAYLYPCIGCEWDFYSWQLSMRQKEWYTYKSAVEAISKCIHF